MVDIYKLKFTVLQCEILRLLFIKAGSSFNARGLAKNLGVSQTAVAKALPLLSQKGFVSVQKDKESGRFSIELNRDNPRVIGFKRAENLRIIYESGLVEFLTERFPGSLIVLFGSFSFGEDTVNSDIDIAVVGVKEKKTDLSGFVKKLQKPIILHFYQSLKGINKNLKENILNGIILKGGVEL